MARSIVKNSKNWAFNRGYSQVPRAKAKKLKNDIKEALGVKAYISFFRHLHGISMHTAEQAKDIEKIFNDIGITDIWGAEPYNYDDENES